MFRKKEATPVLGYLIFEALIMITTSVLVILHLVEQDAVTGICQRMDSQNQGATIRVKKPTRTYFSDAKPHRQAPSFPLSPAFPLP